MILLYQRNEGTVFRVYFPCRLLTLTYTHTTDRSIYIFRNAEGGNADFVQLEQLFATAEPELSERDKENRIRYVMKGTTGQSDV